MRIGRQCAEDFLGTVGEGAFESADVAIGLETQSARFAAAFVQCLQRVLQQRQCVRLRQRSIAQHVVQTHQCLRVFLETEAGQHRRGAYDLCDLAEAGGQDVEVTVAGLADGELRHRLDQLRIEVAARDHRDHRVRAFPQGVQRAYERGEHVRTDVRRRDQRLGVIDRQEQMRVRLFGDFAVRITPEGFGDDVADRFRSLCQHLREIGEWLRWEHRTIAEHPCGESRGERRHGVAIVRTCEITRSHRQRAQTVEATVLGEQRNRTGAQQRGLAAAAGADDQHETAAGLDLAAYRRHQFGGGAAAAEEYAGVIVIEGHQSDVGITVGPCRDLARAAAIVVRERHRRNEAVAALADGFDIAGCAAVVADELAQQCDGPVDRIVAVERAAPDVDQQLVGADGFARLLGQCDQHFHDAWFE